MTPPCCNESTTVTSTNNDVLEETVNEVTHTVTATNNDVLGETVTAADNDVLQRQCRDAGSAGHTDSGGQAQQGHRAGIGLHVRGGFRPLISCGKLEVSYLTHLLTDLDKINVIQSNFSGQNQHQSFTYFS